MNEKMVSRLFAVLWAKFIQTRPLFTALHEAMGRFWQQSISLNGLNFILSPRAAAQGNLSSNADNLATAIEG